MNEMLFERDTRICVYDDVFDCEFCERLYSFAVASRFMIGWADTSDLSRRSHQYLHCAFSEDDVANLGVMHKLLNSKVAAELDGYRLAKCVLNLSTPADVNFIHTHPEDKVLLTYVNQEWRDGYHGETLFFDNTKRNVLFASPFTPNRVIAFPGKCPHSIRPQSHLAPFFRLTLAVVLNKDK